jgi:hypothetical protein
MQRRALLDASQRASMSPQVARRDLGGIGQEETMQPWQAPEFTEIDMNAEIGAYQRDPAQAPIPTRLPLPGQATAAAEGAPPTAAPDRPDAKPLQRG